MSHINQASPEPGIQVGSARVHLSGDGCNHLEVLVRPAHDHLRLGTRVVDPLLNPDMRAWFGTLLGDSNVCPACAELTDDEVAALREYFERIADV